MQPDTLHDRLKAELDRRLAVARAAADQYGACWLITRIPPYTDPVLLAGDGGDDLLSAGTVDLHEAHRIHIALHDPADAIRRYEGELEVLARHAHRGPTVAGAVDGAGVPHPGVCDRCEPGRRHWPCLEIRSLAGRLGVNIDDALIRPERSQQRDTS